MKTSLRCAIFICVDYRFCRREGCSIADTEKSREADAFAAGGKDQQLHSGHRQKLRDRFLKDGLSGFEEHNILELLLFSIQPRKDTNPLAHKLINRFGSISKVFDAPYEELLKTDGVGEQTAAFLTMLPQLCRLYLRRRMEDEGIVGTNAVTEYIANFYIGEKRELITLTLLNNRFQMLATEVISSGTVNLAVLDMRKIIEVALKYNATAAIIAHNHPAGFAIPSKSDLAATQQLRTVLSVINVELIDHIIVSQDGFISLANSVSFKYIFE